jgi:uncharacterized protein
MVELSAAQRQARSLDQVEHRPWPRPARRWTLAQTWEDLLFLHWRVPLEAVRERVPPELEVETYDGSAWLGIVPFWLTNLRMRGLLPLPRVSSFLETNVRTVVRGPDGKPGVWFFSLDASSRLAVEAARQLYRLPYFHARFSTLRQDDWITYECARFGEEGRVFSGRYRPVGEPFTATPGSLEWFLMERYCLYTVDGSGALHRAEIHHRPWPLQPAEAEIDLATLSPLAVEGAPLCHFSRRLDVVVWPLERVR